MTAQFSGPGTQVEKVAMEPVGGLRLSCASHMKYKYLLPNGAQYMDNASEYFRRVARETDSSLVRAVAFGREFFCEVVRILYAPYAPSGEGLSPPGIRLGGMYHALRALRTLSRMVEDAACAVTPFLRAIDARYGYLLKYSMPVS